MGDSKKVTNNIGDEVCIDEKVDERVSEVAGSSGRDKRKMG